MMNEMCYDCMLPVTTVTDVHVWLVLWSTMTNFHSIFTSLNMQNAFIC